MPPATADLGNALADLDLHAVLLDLDGVLYVEDEPVGGAVDAVARLREAGLALRLVTNTTGERHHAPEIQATSATVTVANCASATAKAKKNSSARSA